MKKSYLIALALVFALTTMVWAAPNVGNVSQQGSVLIFPKIVVGPAQDTLVSISNGNNVAVTLKCFWVDKNQVPTDFKVFLTANQPTVFSALTGSGLSALFENEVPPFSDADSMQGELKCFAVDVNEAPINFNFLTGSAKVIDFAAETAFEYNAWSFAARTGVSGAAIAPAGLVSLDGITFDACPNYWLGNFFSVANPFTVFTNTDLTIVPCKEDLTQDRVPTRTKVKFDIWNENEVPLSGVTVCVKCWFENTLSNISPKFAFRNLGTAAARFRAQGVASSVCPGSVKTPIIGLLIEQGTFLEDSRSVTTASTGFNSGIDGSGFIKYDPTGGPQEGPRR